MTENSLYMENLDEYVNDENQIVTYKWLSNTLQIHVNLSKRLLFMFSQQQRNEKDNDDLSVTYFVAGLQVDKNGNKKHVCCVVPETDLNGLKSTLSPVTSCHVYSVHKVKLKDTNALYATDFEKIKEDIFKSSSYSAIQCEKAKPRSREELEKLSLTISSKNVHVTTEKLEKESIPTSSTMTNIKKKTEVKGSIASMFAGGNKKNNIEKENDNVKMDKSAPAKTKEKTCGKKGGMKAFFKPGNKTSPSVIKETKVEINSPVKQKSPVKQNSPKRSGKKKADSELEEDSRKNKTKRRRIKVDVFDSSSSEEEMELLDEEEEEPIPPPKEESPIPSPSKSPSPVKPDHSSTETHKVSTDGERKRKRVKKLVAKTYKDEDGFMITEKVYEIDSTDASDIEDPLPTKVKTTKDTSSKLQTQKKKSPPNKKVSPAKDKQTSLTSFFKKK